MANNGMKYLTNGLKNLFKIENLIIKLQLFK